MRFNILGFALGVCLLQQQPQLPPLAWAVLLAPFLFLWWRLSRRTAGGRGGTLRSDVLENESPLSAAGGNRDRWYSFRRPLLPVRAAGTAATLLAGALFGAA